MSINSAKVREKYGNLIVSAQQNNLPVLYSYCNLFFVRHVRGEFGINGCAFYSTYCLQFRPEKSGFYFCLESGLWLCVRVCVSGFVFHAAVAGDIPQSVAGVADFDSVRSRLLLCHESTRPTFHGRMFFAPSLHIAADSSAETTV